MLSNNVIPALCRNLLKYNDVNLFGAVITPPNYVIARLGRAIQCLANLVNYPIYTGTGWDKSGNDTHWMSFRTTRLRWGERNLIPCILTAIAPIMGMGDLI